MVPGGDAGSGVPSRAVTCRSIRYAWLTCGNGRSPGASMSWMVRVSIRPWPRPAAARATGTSRQGRASRAPGRRGWLSLAGNRNQRRIVIPAVTGAGQIPGRGGRGSAVKVAHGQPGIACPGMSGGPLRAGECGRDPQRP